MEQTDGIKARTPEKPLEPKPETSNPGPKDEPPWASKDMDAEPDSPRDYGAKEY